MLMSDEGRRMGENFEGLVLGAYDDADDHVLRAGERCFGTLTIGYGHTDAAGPPKVYVGMLIMPDIADAILQSDLVAVAIEVSHLVKVPLTQTQTDALIDFQFNTGWLAHPHCSLLAAINAGNMTLAEQDFMLYDRARGKVLAGLTRRRLAEKTLFETGIYPA